MGNRKKNKEENKSLVFMNTPVERPEEDILGFSTHVKKLDAAIEDGATMIALTSPFGAGKTSIIELLQGRYAKNCKKKIIKISMWSQLLKANQKGQKTDGETIDLHRSFVYQLVSQINYKRGVYVSKRLNNNYGLLKLHTNKKAYWLATLAALSLFVCGYVLPEIFEITLPILEERFKQNVSLVNNLMILSAIVILLGVAMLAEIVFSSNKSEGGRRIDSNEIMQLYREEVLELGYSWGGRWFAQKFGVLSKAFLEKANWLSRFFAWLQKTKHYVVVIEDLDRTDDGPAVVRFLKELRKYYLPETLAEKNQNGFNRVTFIVNVKPEALLCKSEPQDEERGHLYAKLFDYVLNLQTIHISDYKTVLEGLLVSKKTEIQSLGLQWQGQMLNIPGMNWIIRGKKLGIREIKDRLNLAFSLYESLIGRFSQLTANLEFEKCAVVAYITTEYAPDFCKTDDTAFQQLVTNYLQKNLDDETCNELLPSTSEDYRKTIKELVESRIIDNNYRVYFYNYPKNSRIPTVDESIVQRAILYGEENDGLQMSAETVVRTGSAVIKESLEVRQGLGLILPNVVFSIETLYVEALRFAFPKILDWLRGLDYSTEAADKTVGQIRKVLHFDNARTVFHKEHASAFCEVWEDEAAEKSLLRLRRILCKEFPNEILWYNSLFFGTHKLVTKEELDTVPLRNALQIINVSNDDFSTDWVAYSLSRFSEEMVEPGLSMTMERFLRESYAQIGDISVLDACLKFMSQLKIIVRDFEEAAFTMMQENADALDELLLEYQNAINQAAEKGLGNSVLKHIFSLGIYEGYSLEVAALMDKAGYKLTYVLMLLQQEEVIPFSRQDIADAIQDDLDWLQQQKENYFLSVRKSLLNTALSEIDRYEFMFGADCPVMTKEELRILYLNQQDPKCIMRLIQPALIAEEEISMLREYFCRAKQGTTQSYEILQFVAKIPHPVAEELFYSLDFEKIQYRRMSGARKKEIKTVFKDILGLDEPKNKIRFMQATKYLDAAWEVEMIPSLKVDKGLRELYVETVNSIEEVSKTTIQTLCALPTIYPMKQHVSDMFLKLKKYRHYVASKTRWVEAFEFESGEQRETLWSTYVEIFGSEKFPRTQRFMDCNLSFLQEIVNSKAYSGLNDTRLLPLAKVYQSKDCLAEVFGRGEEFAIDYLSQIAGFKDESAATYFVEVVEKSATLLRSDVLYENTYDKLVSGVLKGKYTRARKRHGYGK